MNKEKITIEGQLRVKELLKERGMLMKDLADRIGIARESLTRALSGNPQYSTLKAIADELGVTVPELFIPGSSDRNSVAHHEIHGYINYKGEIVEITTPAELERILDRIKEDM